ncbi:SDR family NAD(P)-dependent oxidoreductase [Salinactinospora qingdaonensis]|uniref:SDR family oxidoreductase n=1 Tax=Salinactinospora qingdaonensis TaxID=702744 RepID=A0ABP7FEZ9_9ACTN
MTDDSERVALVTGAGRGIGRSAAIALAASGAHVIINDLTEDTAAKETAEGIRALGRKAVIVPADVAEPDSAGVMVDAAVANFGRLDVLVTSQAHSVREPVLTASPEGVKRTIDVMQLGVFYACQQAARQMDRQSPIGESRGKIIIVSSVRAFLPIGGSAAYNMAKAAVNHFGRTLAAELTSRRINVNMVNPGWIDTPGERGHYTEAEIHAAGAATVPWGRLGHPRDVAAAVRFLASPQADYITGSELTVDGGFTLGKDHYEGLDEAAEAADPALGEATVPSQAEPT